MPFETYYKHGALQRSDGLEHAQVLRLFLKSPGSTLSDVLLIHPNNGPAFSKLTELGFLELNISVMKQSSKNRYRVPPHLVKEVGAFVKRYESQM